MTPPAPSPEEPAPTPTPEPVKASVYYFRPGNLAPSSGTGALEPSVLVPDMLFPIKSAPSIAQTQVYRWGGGVKGGKVYGKVPASLTRDNLEDKRDLPITTDSRAVLADILTKPMGISNTTTILPGWQGGGLGLFG